MEQEIWKDIKDYDGLYQVSNLGRIKRLLNKSYKICNLTLQHGYLYCRLSKNNKQKKYRVHRLVALAFLSNTNNYKEINHINCNKQDNRVENLEWCSSSYNKIHALKNELYKNVKQIVQIKNGKIINTFKNIKTASIKTGFERTCINKCVLGKRNSAYGYQWKYKEKGN